MFDIDDGAIPACFAKYVMKVRLFIGSKVAQRKKNRKYFFKQS